jgi:hypothetical protein
MSYYQKKYLKYKNKYIELKNQIGGHYTLKLDEWEQIENSGQQNCGIFISSVYPTLILKCGTNSYIISMANEINQIMQLFPKIIDNTYIDPNNYTTMQKLDGDITSIFFNLFPKHILEKMLKEKEINEKQKENLLSIFEGKIASTNPNLKSLNGLYENELTFDFLHDSEIYDLYLKYLRTNEDSINNFTDINIKGKDYKGIYNNNYNETGRKYGIQLEILKKIKEITNITFELYNDFMNKLIEMWNKFYKLIIKEIIKLKLILIGLGYSYEDNKFDNYGYILSDEVIKGDFRESNVPKIFDKYLYIFFIDPDSGLEKISDDNDLEIKQLRIKEDINNGMKYFMANGQYPITWINKSILPYDTYDLKLIGINDNDIIKILESKYFFDTDRFNHKFTNIDEIKNFVGL